MRKIIIVLLVVGILLSGCPDPGNTFPEKEPLKESSRSIRNLVNELGIPKRIRGVVFEKDSVLPVRPIEESRSELDIGHICVVVGNSLKSNDQFGVLTTKGRDVAYFGDTAEEKALWLLCSRGKEIENDLSENSLNTEIDVSNCADEFRSLLNSAQRVCIIAITEE